MNEMKLLVEIEQSRSNEEPFNREPTCKSVKTL
jgi:hypothetical protein